VLCLLTDDASVLEAKPAVRSGTGEAADAREGEGCDGASADAIFFRCARNAAGTRSDLGTALAMAMESGQSSE
jgi:hypothetical protein